MDVDTDFIRKVLADHLDNTTLAGDPRFPNLIATILKNYFGFKDNSKLCAHTYSTRGGIPARVVVEEDDSGCVAEERP